ncbi:MAG: hypothetical protein F4057_09995 [Acidobacteria bacterium]|nr:hypothetical protein [Rhodothermaceae bacterium]MYI75617.1 hypothetical protein [Acidobacteriota bacterium]
MAVRTRPLSVRETARDLDADVCALQSAQDANELVMALLAFTMEEHQQAHFTRVLGALRDMALETAAQEEHAGLPVYAQTFDRVIHSLRQLREEEPAGVE